MSDNNVHPIGVKHRDPLEDAKAIKRCLDYLRIEADRTGLSFAAHLIGVASEAVSDSIALSEQSVARIDGTNAGEDTAVEAESSLRRS